MKQHEGLNASYIEPPFDVERAFGARRVKVHATFYGRQYRGSIIRMGGVFIPGVTQEIRREIGKGFADAVHVTLEKDEAARAVELRAELYSLLSSNPAALSNCQAMPHSARKDYASWVDEAVKQEQRPVGLRRRWI